MATLYKIDGTQEQLAPANGKHFTLEELQKAIGSTPKRPAYVQLIRFPDGRQLIVDEEGLIKLLPINIKMTELIYSLGGSHGLIVGPALLCDPGELE